jgi:hypothetical protein
MTTTAHSADAPWYPQLDEACDVQLRCFRTQPPWVRAGQRIRLTGPIPYVDEQQWEGAVGVLCGYCYTDTTVPDEDPDEDPDDGELVYAGAYADVVFADGAEDRYYLHFDRFVLVPDEDDDNAPQED